MCAWAPGARGQPVEPLPFEHVPDADTDRVETVEDIELGQSDTVDARNLGDLPDENAVEPSAAPLAARNGAELVATLAELFAHRVRQLRRKRPGTDAGRVGLRNAEHIAEGARPDTRTRGRLRRDRIRRGHERVSSVVDIQKCALRTFEQDALVVPARLVEQVPRNIHVRQDFRRNIDQLGDELIFDDFGLAEATAQGIMVREYSIDFRPERCRRGQILKAYRAAADFIFVSRTDTAARRADFFRACGRLANDIEFAVQTAESAWRFPRYASCRA